MFFGHTRICIRRGGNQNVPHTINFPLYLRWTRKYGQGIGLTGMQKRETLPYGKSFGWTPYTLGGGGIRPYQDTHMG